MISFHAILHLICLELPHHIDQDSPVKHWVAVNGGDIVTDFLNVKRKVKIGYLSLCSDTLFWKKSVGSGVYHQQMYMSGAWFISSECLLRKIQL